MNDEIIKITTDEKNHYQGEKAKARIRWIKRNWKLVEGPNHELKIYMGMVKDGLYSANTSLRMAGFTIRKIIYFIKTNQM